MPMIKYEVRVIGCEGCSLFKVQQRTKRFFFWSKWADLHSSKFKNLSDAKEFADYVIRDQKRYAEQMGCKVIV